MSALEFFNVSKNFGEVAAVQDFSLSVNEGELITLLGPSGCGKTTALRIAAGFEKEDSGAILLGSHDISNLPSYKRQMGMVFQSYSLFPHLTIRDNVAFGLRMQGVRRGTREKRAERVLELVRLPDLGHRMPHQLSGGQQQRAALARALAAEPKVLLLDEPLSALDAQIRVEVRDEIRRLNRDIGVTTLFVTHDQDEALSISDRICVMNGGKIEQVGTPREIYDSPRNSFIAHFVGTMNMLPADEGDIFVRPEQLILTTDFSATHWNGHVSDIAFVGAFMRVTIDVTGSNKSVVALVASSEIAVDLAIGDRVGMDVVGTARTFSSPSVVDLPIATH